ncbi:hypothetical protein TNCV_149661 [Trichonephila clavipes]|nr:hypothetical protein TNCV_149661 [Trichonephila clavipes]
MRRRGERDMCLIVPHNITSGDEPTLVLKTTPTLDSELMMGLHDPLRPEGNMPVFLTANDKGPLRSSMAFRITVQNPSIPYSASSHWMATDASSNATVR